MFVWEANCILWLIRRAVIRLIKIATFRAVVIKSLKPIHAYVRLHWIQYMWFHENNSKISNQFNGPNHCAAHYPDWSSMRVFQVSYFWDTAITRVHHSHAMGQIFLDLFTNFYVCSSLGWCLLRNKSKDLFAIKYSLLGLWPDLIYDRLTKFTMHDMCLITFFK